MTFIDKLASAAAVAALAITPVAATANPAASLSVAKATRASSGIGGDSRIAEGSTATLISVGILAALVVIVLVATGGDDEDSDSD